jgi:conjugal transfer pilus assembly protein TraB
MPTDAPAPAAAAASRRIVACLLLVAIALAAFMLALPIGAPLAANPDDDAPGAAAPGAGTGGAPASSNFGSAVPSDQFVQSFQQQVSQQLQSAIAQANDAQAARIRSFEDQQKELSDHVQALQQSLDARAADSAAASLRGAGTGGPAAEVPDPEPPRVNLRHAPPGADGSGEGEGTGSADGWSRSLPAILDGMAGGGGTPLDLAHGAAPADATAWRGAGSTPRATRAGDADISPHGFVEGRLLNGVVAIVGGPDRESVVALNGRYQAANGFLADLDGCFALVQGKPEIAAGRIDFKLARLTCNFADGASRTWDAAGWLVDADGIRGVRATIVENAGRKAAVAAAGGAIGGIGQRLSQQQYQISSISSGIGSGTSSTFIGSAGQDALGGAASGAANALGSSIADYYNLYSPSLQVGGGTPVTVVLANDLRLPPSGRDISATHTAAP